MDHAVTQGVNRWLLTAAAQFWRLDEVIWDLRWRERN
jgi:hypothetical protein